MTVIDIPFMVCHSKQVVHRLIPLRRGHVGGQVQVVEGEGNGVLKLCPRFPAEFEAFEAYYEHSGQLPDVYFLFGALVALAVLAVPLVLPVQDFLLAELSEAGLKRDRW